MTMSRKPEVGCGRAAAAGAAGQHRAPASPATTSTSRPTSPGIARATSIVTDGYGNSRIVKIDANGKFVKSWGTRGSEPGQFNLPLSIAIDAQDNIYVADRGNKRIQVFDTDGA